MADLVRVDRSHFPQLLPLLKGFRNKRISDAMWERLFIRTWAGNEDYTGYALREGERFVGFLGLVFSRQLLPDGRTANFCNLSSWIVEEPYRNQAVAMVLPLFRLKDCTITNLTPADSAFAVFSKLGFRVLDAGVRVLLPLPGRKKKGVTVTTDKAAIAARLGGTLQTIAADHAPYECGQLLLESPQGACLVLHKKRRYAGIAFTHILYVSDPQLFAACLENVRLRFCRLNRTPLTMIDTRFCPGGRLARSFFKSFPNPLLYKSGTLTPEQIPDSYSEIVLLNI